MHRHNQSLPLRGHQSACDATVTRVAIHDCPLPLLAIAKLCWAYTVVVAATAIALNHGVARGAEDADDGPDMAAYYQAAPQEMGPRVAAVVYGDETIGSGVASRSAGELESSENTAYSDSSLGYEHEWYPEGSVSENGSRTDRSFYPGQRVGEGRGWLSTMTSNFGDELEGDFSGTACQCGECNGYHWEFLPKDSLYPFYLADTKASRMAGQWIEATDDGTLMDATLGGRFGVFRYVDATPGPFKRGIQADFEGSAQVRLDMDREHDVRAVDFRAGVPISVSFGRFQTRFGYYHLSSHVGDEFLIRLPAFERQNYSRDVLFLGGAYWLNESTRVYGEAGWAFYYDVCEPWEFTFGIESAPRRATGLRGAPFYAINGRLREEVDFGGALTAQLGWAWRSAYNTGLLRTGLHYFNGKSNQFSFYDEHEELIGAGLWYDF